VAEDDDVLRWFVQGSEEGRVGHEAGDLIGVSVRVVRRVRIGIWRCL
jgi:hypothetical protein